jgi:hypothetical protein
MRTRRRNAALIAMIAGLAGATGCTDITFGGGDDFEGVYDYAGTVDGKPGDVVSGTVTITRQRGDPANVVIDWRYFDDGDQILRITTQSAAVADLDHDGRIRFDFEGDLFIDNRRTFFRLDHDGRLDRRTITGSWLLTTDLPTTDRGAFVARD